MYICVCKDEELKAVTTIHYPPRKGCIFHLLMFSEVIFKIQRRGILYLCCHLGEGHILESF